MRLFQADKLQVALLALGTFAIGTEDLLIAGILPEIAADLSVSVATAGQLVTVFALTFAIASPVLITMTSQVKRKRLLVAALLLFGASNALAAVSQSYEVLFLARILAACAAGIYSPMAVAASGPGITLYTLSKAAVAGFTRALARDLGPRSITVNCVQPGPTDTDMNPADPADNPTAEGQAADTALGRYGRPEDLARFIAFLASPESAYVTGAVINVDGGSNA